MTQGSTNPSPKPDPRQIDQRDPEQTRQHPRLPPHTTRPTQNPTADSAEAKPKTRGQADPQIIRETYLPKCFLNWYREGASLVSVERLFHILAPRKEKTFCPCAVFFLGNLTSVLVLRRLREERALFLLKSSQRYFGARFLGDLKVTIFD